MIRYIQREKKYDPRPNDEIGQELMKTWDYCPVCKLRSDDKEVDVKQLVDHYKAHDYHRYIFGLWRDRCFTFEGKCTRCGSRWEEDRRIAHTLEWHPLRWTALKLWTAFICSGLATVLIIFLIRGKVVNDQRVAISTETMSLSIVGIVTLLAVALCMIVSVIYDSYDKTKRGR